MTTEWVITSAAERINLGDGNRGEMSFTVTNPATAQDRVVFEVVAGDGASETWFSVEEPQRLVAGGGSVSYMVKVAVPAGAPAGEYWLQGRAYSADSAPEEGSRLSGRVAFTVAPSAKPKRPWWPYAVAAGLLLVVLAVVGILVFGDDGGDPQTQPTTPAPRPTPIRSGELDIPQTWTVDFDNGVVGAGADADVWFQAQTATIRHFTVRGTAKQQYLGTGGEADPGRCTGMTAEAIPFLSLDPGGVLCVQTGEGQIAVATVKSRIDPSPGRIVLQYDLFDAP